MQISGFNPNYALLNNRAGGQNAQMVRSKFAESLHKAAGSGNVDAASFSGGKAAGRANEQLSHAALPHVMMSSTGRPVFGHISRLNQPITTRTEHLTDEQRRWLNERHNVNNIRQGTPEYSALMNDLKEMGVISHSVNPNLFTAHSLGVDEDGYIVSMMHFVGSSEEEPLELKDLFDWLIKMRAEMYRDLFGAENRSKQDELLFNLHVSQRNILSAIRDIFPS